MWEIYWVLLLTTTREDDQSNTEQGKKVSYDAVPTVTLNLRWPLGVLYLEAKSQAFTLLCHQLLNTATSGEGLKLEPDYFLWPKPVPGERLTRELLIINIHSSGRNERFSPEEEFWAAHYSIHYNEMPNSSYISNASCE